MPLFLGIWNIFQKNAAFLHGNRGQKRNLPDTKPLEPPEVKFCLAMRIFSW